MAYLKARAVKAVVEIPTASSSTYTYNGSEQTYVFDSIDSTHVLVSGNTQTNADTYTVTCSLKSKTYMWSDSTTADKTYEWTIDKAQGAISISPSSITFDSETTTATLVPTITGDGTVTYSGYDTAIITIEGNVVTATEVGGSTTITATLSETSNYLGATTTVSVTASYSVIYGISWDGSSSPAWTRTDAAVSFDDPNPYYADMTDTPSSPFDNILPWSGMVRVTDSEAGELVAIPKYYYKWTKSGTAMTLQISAEEFDGSYVSPAHADKGDGVGERDIVYVGRYNCASDYTSKTGVAPVANITLATGRTNIHALGNTIWQQDYAMYWTIRMLYLVEFANWNSQAKIGYGCSTGGSAAETMGTTDSMPYHTGTPAATRTTYGHTQYRYIEDLWGNVYERVDGTYMSSKSLYCIKNPADFADTSGGTLIGSLYTDGNAMITEYAIPGVAGFEYALYPIGGTSNVGDYSTYVCDFYGYPSSSSMNGFMFGQHWSQGQECGLFRFNANATQTLTGAAFGCRLMKLPA